jgi:hypothetical protein
VHHPRFFASSTALDISPLRLFLAVQIKDAKPGKPFKDDSGKELSFREVCGHESPMPLWKRYGQLKAQYSWRFVCLAVTHTHFAYFGEACCDQVLSRLSDKARRTVLSAHELGR